MKSSSTCYWPLFFAFLLTRWRRRYALLVALVIAAASASLMAVLYQPGLDPSRVYYGTDTRAAGLLIGAALAFAWTPARAADYYTAVRCLRARRNRHLVRLKRRWNWTLPALLDLLVLTTLGCLVWACLRVGESQAFLYQGGFALVGLATAAAILATVHPRARLGTRLLGWRPLLWIGLRSYGIYLWHWPVYMITRPDLDVHLHGLPLLALRLTTTLALADLSYRYVEVPARSGALGRAWRSLREARGLRRWGLGAGWVGAVGASVTFSVVLGMSVVHAEPPPPPSYLASMEARSHLING